MRRRIDQRRRSIAAQRPWQAGARHRRRCSRLCRCAGCCLRCGRRCRQFGNPARAAPGIARGARADQAPGDVPAAIGKQQVLRRNAGAVGHRKRCLQIARCAHLGEVQPDRTGQLRRPAQCQRAAVGVDVQYRSPRRFTDLELHRRCARHADGFHVPGQCLRVTQCRCGNTREIRSVDVTVGKCPSHMPVAAHDHRRQTRQGESGDIHLALGRIAVCIAQPCAEPDIGRAQAQVHVVGNDGAAVGGEAAIYREVVAARRRRFRVWCGRRMR